MYLYIHAHIHVYACIYMYIHCFFYKNRHSKKTLFFIILGLSKTTQKLKRERGEKLTFSRLSRPRGHDGPKTPPKGAPSPPNPRFCLFFNRFGGDFSPMFAPFRIDFSSRLGHLEKTSLKRIQTKMIVTSTLIQARWRLLAGGTGYLFIYMCVF